MRLSTRVAALCVGLFVSHHGAAAELPQRWVSAGGALSEWVSALGGESKLVGVDTTSQHPECLKTLPSIGYQRQLSAEGILSLRPQLLIGTEGMGPPPVLLQIRNIAGKDTAADWLLQQAGGHNLATHTGYKPFSVESLVSLDPEVLVFAYRALTGDVARAALFKENPMLSSTRAARDGRVIELDPTLLAGGQGPRLPDSLKKLSDGFFSGTVGQ